MKARKRGSDRLTISLAQGQRQILEEIASYNNTTLAHVVRHALSRFIEENRDNQIPLRFPTARRTEE